MARNGASARPAWRRWTWRLVQAGLALALVGIIALITAVTLTVSSLPGYEELKSSQNGQMIVVRAADGTEIMSLGPSFGKWLALDDIPPVMQRAMVAVEDRRYYSHPGVDPMGLARAVWVAFERRGEGRWQGASTITQQVARTIFLNNRYSWTRKLREMLIALSMERKFSKEQILELYLNKVYFGGGAYGVDAASRKFFGHGANELSLEEAAIIAGLVKAPSRYSPTADAKAAIDRAGVVLQVMQATNAISAREAAEANVGAVRLAGEKGQNSARYFTDWALPQLDLVLPENDEPIEVWTTLDLRMQRAATAAVQAHVPRGSQGALVAMDRDGAVRAMVGGTDYVSSNYNRATNAVRQPGSAWKLFVYLAALEAGYTPDDPVVDQPVTIAGWSPRNSGGSYAGEIDVRTAFAYSKNTVAAQLGEEIGFGVVASMARRFGITTPVNTLPSMVLGTSDVRLIDMTRAFAAVAAKGVAIQPYGITRVRTVDGETLYEHKADLSQVLVPPYVAAGITDLLQTAVNTGTGKAAQIGRPVAGKTGTTSSNKDGWFLGFSSGITTGVWMGRDDARAVPGLQGGTAPARTFAQFMRTAVAGRPVEEFETELTLPEWQLEPDEEAWFEEPPTEVIFEDESGLPIESGSPFEAPRPRDPGTAVDEGFLDRALGRQRDWESGQEPEQPRPNRQPAPALQAPPPPRDPDE